MTLKMSLLRCPEDLDQKHLNFIYDIVVERISAIKEAAEFVTRMKDQYQEYVTVTFYLPSYQDEYGFKSFRMEIEFFSKIGFWLFCNEGEGMILDIEGFDCWNKKDEDELEIRRKKIEEEEGMSGGEETEPAGSFYFDSRLEP